MNTKINPYLVKANITWVAGDVQTLKPDWTIEQCEDWLSTNAKYIEARSVELGWEVIEDLLP